MSLYKIIILHAIEITNTRTIIIELLELWSLVTQHLQIVFLNFCHASLMQSQHSKHIFEV